MKSEERERKEESVAVGKSLPFPEPYFPNLKSKTVILIYLQCCKDKMKQCKVAVCMY